jgi:DeoR family glycerol-3-phosphate regulon repressor
MIVAADHTKFGAKAANVSCPFDKVTDLVTDIAPPDAFAPVLKQAGVQVHIESQYDVKSGPDETEPRKQKKNKETSESKAGKSGSRKRKTK